jgi:phosphoribosylglycinamide formyltransferase-1
MKKLRLGFLASHGGSNMLAIVNAIKAGKLDAEAAVVISNNSYSGALEKANNEGIPHFHISGKTHGEKEAETICNILKEHKVDLVILAGYMKKIGEEVLSEYKGRILNIHPALLPKHGGAGMYGMNVHTAVIAAKETESGPTVHLIDEHYDRGRILAQTKVPVLPEDTPETLAERVLKAEHIIYAETIQKIATGEIEL